MGGRRSLPRPRAVRPAAEPPPWRRCGARFKSRRQRDAPRRARAADAGETVRAKLSLGGAQLDRASPPGEGRTFESCRGRHLYLPMPRGRGRRPRNAPMRSRRSAAANPTLMAAALLMGNNAAVITACPAPFRGASDPPTTLPTVRARTATRPTPAIPSWSRSTTTVADAAHCGNLRSPGHWAAW